MAQRFTDVKEALAFVRSTLQDSVSTDGQLFPPQDQLHITAELNELSAILSPPRDPLAKLCWGHHILVPTKIALGMGVFQAFASKGFEPQNLNQLHKQTRGDVELLGRIMRMLCAGNILQEIDLNTWKPLPLALALGSNKDPAAGFVEFAYFQLKASSGLFEYLERTGFKNPDDAFDGPFQSSLDTRSHLMEYLDNLKDPRARDGFDVMMGAQSSIRGQDWFKFFPVEEKLALTSSSSDVHLVDIGGNLGQDAARLRNEFPNLPGRIIVQDITSVIKKIDPDNLPSGVEAMPHNMFTPQPVRGAKAYYFRTVLHDWPDKQALEILTHIKNAMGPDSILLVNDNVIPDMGAPAVMANIDYFLLDLWTAKERTEEEWKSLLERAGFSLVKVWRPTEQGMGTFNVFEAKVV